MTHHVEKKVLPLWRIPAMRQTYVILGPMSLIFSAGVFMGTSTVMMPQLKKDDSDIYVSESMSAWLYSVNGIGSMPTVLLVPYISQWKGYKLTFVLICLPVIIAFILHLFATNAVHLLIAGLCQGVTMGGNISLGIISITEYAEPRLRSFFLVMKSASFFWGIWTGNIIGTFSYWRNIPLLGIWPALFALFSCIIWPEGPYWLASVGRIEECKKSFVWLRGPENDKDELAAIIKNQTKNSDNSGKSNLVSKIKKSAVCRQFYMPFAVNCVLYSLYQFSGKIVMTVYALVIIEDITKSESTAYAGMLLIDGVTVVGMYIGSYVAMNVRRRNMFLITSAVTIFFLYVLCLYLSLVAYDVVTQNNVVSLTLLVLYTFAVSWGPMVLSTSFTSEIAPMRFKAFIVAVGSCVFWGLQTANLRLAPILMANVGMHGSFGIYGTFTLLFWIYLYKYLPETNNKTLQELELCFVKDKDKRKMDDVIEN
ncbi:facilitated trehalose transporter Tret1-like [Choristoneura fumiferana]|uniref:facilitated trehalose transporter Tret1-like n=1 Tax=Choristoneura fumiferana TaxID=7141 RepID=UPI003D157DFB